MDIQNNQKLQLLKQLYSRKVPSSSCCDQPALIRLFANSSKSSWTCSECTLPCIPKDDKVVAKGL